MSKDPDIYFKFLDDLRESGVTNMFGAASYLEVAFPELTKLEAKTLLIEWISYISSSLDKE